MIQVRQLEKKDTLAATNLWASSMRGSNYGEWQNRINSFVESKLNDPSDMGDVYANYVDNDMTKVNESGSKSKKSKKCTKTSEQGEEDKGNLSIRNFWVVEYISSDKQKGNGD